jgi:hypothetical protein
VHKNYRVGNFEFPYDWLSKGFIENYAAGNPRVKKSSVSSAELKTASSAPAYSGEPF